MSVPQLTRLIVMRPISEVADQELLWVQPAALKRAHELRAGDQVVATLAFQRGSLADAVADTDVATFRPRWMGGGTLELPGGKTIDLSPANLWQTQWAWKEGDSTPVIFKSRHGLMKSGAEVDVAKDGMNRPDLPLLVLLGYYLILLYAQDVAAASAASVTVISTSG